MRLLLAAPGPPAPAPLDLGGKGALPLLLFIMSDELLLL